MYGIKIMRDSESLLKLVDRKCYNFWDYCSKPMINYCPDAEVFSSPWKSASYEYQTVSWSEGRIKLAATWWTRCGVRGFIVFGFGIIIQLLPVEYVVIFFNNFINIV